MNILIWSLPILAGMLDAAQRGVIKLTKVHKFTLLAGGFISAIPYYCLWLFIDGIPEVKLMFWIAVAAHIPLFVIANILTVEAHRSSPLILTIPYLSFTPVVLLVTSPLMGGGNPTMLGGLGIGLVAFGMYILNSRSDQTNFLSPFKAFLRERGCWMMMIVAIIFGITSNLDYIGFKNSSAPFWCLVDHGLSGLAMIGLAVIYASLGKIERSSISPKGAYAALMLYGLVISGSVIFHMLSFKWIPVVPYVISGKRAGSIIFTVLLGLFFCFFGKSDFSHEREELKYRIPGMLIMVFGMLIIIVWGKN